MKNNCNNKQNKPREEEQTKTKEYKKQWNIDRLPSRSLNDYMRNLR